MLELEPFSELWSGESFLLLDALSGSESSTRGAMASGESAESEEPLGSGDFANTKGEGETFNLAAIGVTSDSGEKSPLGLVCLASDGLGVLDLDFEVPASAVDLALAPAVPLVLEKMLCTVLQCRCKRSRLTKAEVQWRQWKGFSFVWDRS